MPVLKKRDEALVKKKSRVIFHAITTNDLEIVTYLLEDVGVDVKRLKNKAGLSVIHVAVASPSVDLKIIEILLKHGAELDQQNRGCIRPYHIALRNGNYPALEYLIRQGARVEVDDIVQARDMPRYCAAAMYDRVDVHEVSSTGYTALHKAVYSNDINGIKILVRRGADVNSMQGNVLYTPLYWAKSVECVELLLQHGAAPNLEREHDGTLLFRLSFRAEDVPPPKQKELMVAMLFENGADPVEAIEYGSFIRMYSIQHAFPYFEAELLIKYIALNSHIFHFLYDKIILLFLPAYSRYFSTCVAELVMAKGEIISMGVTVFDILTVNMNTLTNYVNNKAIMHRIQKKKIKFALRYPNYNAVFRRRIQTAISKLKLRDSAAGYLSTILPVDAQNLATRRILSYLKDWDTTSFVEAFKFQNQQASRALIKKKKVAKRPLPRNLNRACKAR